MVEYRKHILDNGLTVLTHEAWDTPLATVNLLYNVGSRDEEPHLTGFAHLFEHLMFGGTRRVHDFDRVVSSLGGECNAFTNCDYTNYYTTVPAGGLSTALMLEADRMACLSIDERALEVQKKVVTEEYNQRYMNRPYGDVWLLLRPLCYKVHPYRWPTIGADIGHVAEARLEDVQAFHSRFYRAGNAILAIAAPMRHDDMLREVEKVQWGAAGSADPVQRSGPGLPVEPPQTEARELRVRRDVPAPMVYVAWPMWGYGDARFRACDLVSDLLGNGTSSRLHSRLVRERALFTEADASITGEEGPGLMVLSGRLAEGVDMETGVAALRDEALRLAADGLSDYELVKVQNKFENNFMLGQYKAADRAMALCHYTWLGDTSMVNNEPAAYRRVGTVDIQRTARELFVPQKENILYYGTGE